MKRKLLAFSFVAICGGSTVFAQQDMALTHFIFNKMTVNPGVTGLDDGICATATYRNQWDKVAGAPVSTLFNVEANMNRFFPGGVGLSFYHDAIGFNRQNNLALNYSYPLDLAGYGTLGVGIGVGLVNLGMSPVWVPPTTMNDNTLPVGFGSTNLDLNFGLYYKGDDDVYAGLSATHLSESTLSSDNALPTTYKTVRHYYIMGGKKFNQVAKNIDVDANLMLQTDMVKTSLYLTGRAIWNNVAYAGLGFRNTDAIAVMLGYSPMTNLTIGYSFDINAINKLSSISRGTHEVMLRYCYYLPPPPIQKSKHPRWL